jgi:hypothetical protein
MKAKIIDCSELFKIKEEEKSIACLYSETEGGGGPGGALVPPNPGKKKISWEKKKLYLVPHHRRRRRFQNLVVPNLVLAIARTVVHIAFTQVPRSNHREPCIVYAN